MITIIPAAEEQLDDILAVEAESFTCPWSRRSFREALEAENITFFSAVDDEGTLCGFACLLIIDAEAEVLNIAVAERFRRQGIGALLMNAMITAAQARSVEAMYLEVRLSNASARHLYEKNGFAVTGIRKKYYSRPTEDAVLMCRITPAEQRKQPELSELSELSERTE